jgi:hypothetical protein
MHLLTLYVGRWPTVNEGVLLLNYAEEMRGRVTLTALEAVIEARSLRNLCYLFVIYKIP